MATEFAGTRADARRVARLANAAGVILGTGGGPLQVVTKVLPKRCWSETKKYFLLFLHSSARRWVLRYASFSGVVVLF